ncbi:MAG TPA: M50 family metallopeptidase [Dermatophilaceae bacterium]|nr:M50 family metallopeptidase [Dermatophilaceae bacterium]
MDIVREVWQRALTTQPAPSGWVIAITAVLAALLVWAPGAWPITRHVVTIAHEAAHGVAALMSGRRLHGIRLHSDTSGVTVSAGRTTGPGMILTTAAGYVGPGLLGLAAAALLSHHRAVGLLWALLIFLALLLIQVRNWFGLWSILVSAAVVFAVSWWLEPQMQSAFAYSLTWFLLLAAPRPVLELQRQRRSGRGATSDADQLARLTMLPAIVWVGFFLLVTVGALALGGRWMLDAAA